MFPFVGAPDRPALVLGPGESLTYRDLSAALEPVRELFGSGRKVLVAIFGDRDLATVIGYLAALAGGHACALYRPTLPGPAQQSVIDAYQPDFVVNGTVDLPGYRPTRIDHIRRRATRPDGEISESTALVLSTSGSTGTPRAVRLSYRNLTSNATAIATALAVTAADRAITALPLHYCYGLSVLNSHLAVGASVSLTGDGPSSRNFWRRAATDRCTNLAGVPTTYELLRRSRIDLDAFPSLRLLTQAGGRLAQPTVDHFADLMDRRGGELVVMYGQTEATARMSCLPHEHRVAGRGSVGRAVPGGHLSVEAGEVVYEGPNVMLGYATGRADLALGDVTGGRLRTGDLGYLKDGWLYLTGRAARFAKIQGQRINLDDVERAATEVGPSAVVSAPDEHLVIFVEGDADRFAPLRSRLASQLAIPVRAIQIRALERVPTGESGKTDHATLRRMANP